MRVQIGRSKPLKFEQITSLSAATSLTPPTSEAAVYAVIHTETQNVRWRDDGTDPTAAIGMRLLKDGGELVYDGDLSAIRFIQEASAARLNVSYYANAK